MPKYKIKFKCLIERAPDSAITISFGLFNPCTSTRSW
ncbi:hypothetical protein Cflav_PD4145 [Pedosphaera parvula Ellin514]|uniref:Uncharacterized protein n=1 Tax=Pedosphaera parvula (strain Ellin514) TaxID=320771 RepID=B9XEW9_PEDPL|nr:hypothetical protein Cflav_PD4145 [Pedosphaera parvula Ellin514]